MSTSQGKKALRTKQYMQTTYSSFWRHQVQRYGFSSYHSSLVEVITSLTTPGNGRMLEVGVGTGWPFAAALSQQGYIVVGVDLAESLIQEARAKPGGIRCVVGDAEELPFADNSIDMVYCLQSTWQFPNLPQAIAEMVRVTRPGGTVLFDVMNLASRHILWAEIWDKRLSMNNWKRRFKNIARYFLRRPLAQNHTEPPTTPWRVSRILSALPVSYRVALPENTHRTATWLDHFHPRLVYICNRL